MWVIRALAIMIPPAPFVILLSRALADHFGWSMIGQTLAQIVIGVSINVYLIDYYQAWIFNRKGK
jgi:hypothetical protein